MFFGRNIGLKKSFWFCLTFNVEHKEQKESLPFVNKATNQVSLQNLTPALRWWGVQYKKLNATSKRLWPNCDFAMMTDNLSTHNLHTTIQHVEILYDIFLRLECKSGWVIWIFPIEYTIALRIIKFMINDIPLNCWLVFSYFVAIVV